VAGPGDQGPVYRAGAHRRQHGPAGGGHRRAELSYAEVKAIASGNPAVLTLAEADAALYRLQVLQKHHADEQYLARRQRRALPADIERLERRVAALIQDITTAEGHANALVTIGTRRYSRHDAVEALAAQLQSLPALVYDKHTVALGQYRGLRFGLVQHPQGAPEVYVEGTLKRYAPLARDVHGPRAMLNAVERLIGSATMEHDRATRDLEIARASGGTMKPGWAQPLPMRVSGDPNGPAQPARGRAVPPAQDGAEASLPSVGALVECLKALHAAHTLEVAPERSAPRAPRPSKKRSPRAFTSASRLRSRPSRGHAGAGLSSTACIAACHRSGASGHACPGTPGTLGTSAAVAPILGTAEVA